MRISLMAASVAAAFTVWAPPGFAREAVVLPGVVGAEGMLNGVDTTGDATLEIANSQNINVNNDLGGSFTTANNLQGNLLFLGNSTVTGATGAIGSRFLNVSAGAPGTTTNFNGAVYSSTFNISGTGNVIFNGDVVAAPLFASDGFITLGANRTLTGAITTNTANTGTLTLNGGSRVVGAIGGANGIKQINVVGNAAVTGAVQAQNVSLGAHTLAITGALTTNAGGTIATTLASDSVYGRISADTSLINAGGVTVVPTVTGALTNGTSYRIVDAAAGTIGAVVSVVNNNPRYTFSGVPTTTGDVNIRLTGVAPLASLVIAPGAAAVAPLLDTNAAPGSDLLAVQNAIAVLPSAAAINSALAQLAPGTAQVAAPRVTWQTTQLLQDLWMSRVDALQSSACDSPERKAADAAGKASNCKASLKNGNWWAKGFGNVGRQGEVENRNGYRTEALGLMLAYDTPVTDTTRVGLAGSYGNTEIDGNNSTGQTKVDSYQLTAYVAHAPGPWYAKGALSAGADRYDGSRTVEFAGINRTISGDYSGHQVSAIVSAGRHFFFEQTTLTPFASLQAARVHVNGYGERGGGDLNLRVSGQYYNFLQSGLGVKAERAIQTATGVYLPELHFKWLHDFNSTTMQQDASFSGGGASFATRGIKEDRDLFNVGAGFSFVSFDHGPNPWTVKGLYDYKWNQNRFSSHQASIVASMKF